MHRKIKNLSISLKDKGFLKYLQTRLLEEFNVKLKIGVEVEFFCENTNYDIFTEVNDLFNNVIFKKERGKYQYEYNITPPFENIESLSNKILETNLKIKEYFAKQDIFANFSPKPYFNDYGNSMQFHVSFNDPKPINLSFMDILNYFCFSTNKFFAFYVSNEEDYDRFDSKFMSPMTVSIGNINNRTSSYRIINKKDWHFENRIPSPISCPYLCLSNILITIYLCLKDFKNGKIYDKKHQIVYGNAADPEYNLNFFPKNLAEAMEICDFKIYEDILNEI